MSFSNSVKQAIEIVKLNGKVAESVSKDTNALPMGILILIIGSILTVTMVSTTGTFKLSFIILAPVLSVIFFFVGAGITHLLARLFGGQAKYIEYTRAASHSTILGWSGVLGIIPFLGGFINFLVSIWGIVVSVVILENVHKLTRKNAIIVVLLPVAVIILLVAMGAIAYFGVLSPGEFMPAT